MDQSRTYFIDIDGTLLRFSRTFKESLHWTEPLPGVEEKLLEIHRRGDKIILTTGRPEPFRKRTEEQLRLHGLVYDQLVMGCGSGLRILVNDIEPWSDENMKGGELHKAFAINLKRDEGIANLEIDV